MVLFRIIPGHVWRGSHTIMASRTHTNKSVMAYEIFKSGSRKEGQEGAFFELQPFSVHNITIKPNHYVRLERDEGLKMYKLMNTIRKLEHAAAQLYQEKKIRGFCHLYSGQESVAVGVKAAMRDQDTVITSYRAHGWFYLMSGRPEALLCELTGKATGCSRGKGGSMHLYCNKFFGGNGIVGAQVPLGTGIALHHKLKETGGISFTVYGEGAANQGQVFEAFNMAKLWNLPVIYVCENNHFGMGTSAVRSSASVDYYKRGDFVPGIKVDGMDVLAVKEATLFAVSHCCAGKGPIILEMDTYRYAGHSMSDPGSGYRTRDEVAERRKRDPISLLRGRMLSSNLATESELQIIDNEVKTQIENSMKRAVEDDDPGMNELTTGIYKMNVFQGVRGCVNLSVFKGETTQNELFAKAAESKEVAQ